MSDKFRTFRCVVPVLPHQPSPPWRCSVASVDRNTPCRADRAQSIAPDTHPPCQQQVATGSAVCHIPCHHHRCATGKIPGLYCTHKLDTPGAQSSAPSVLHQHVRCCLSVSPRSGRRQEASPPAAADPLPCQVCDGGLVGCHSRPPVHPDPLDQRLQPGPPPRSSVGHHWSCGPGLHVRQQQVCRRAKRGQPHRRSAVNVTRPWMWHAREHDMPVNMTCL